MVKEILTLRWFRANNYVTSEALLIAELSTAFGQIRVGNRELHVSHPCNRRQFGQV